MQKASTIDEFISQFPAKQQKLIQQLHKAIFTDSIFKAFGL